MRRKPDNIGSYVMNLFSFQGKVTTNHLESDQIISNVCHICQRKLSRRSMEEKRKLQFRINCSSKVVHHRVKENYISPRLEPNNNCYCS